MCLASESIIALAGVAATRGHLSGNGGLRGHSVGGVFPCVMYAQGKIDELSYHFIAPSGQHYGPFSTWDAAYAAAEQWLKEREV